MTEKTKIKEWDQQPDEKNNHYYFFLKYLKEKGKISIPKFYQKIKKQSNKNQEFDYKIPTWKTFETWAYVNGWIKRKEAYQKHQNELLLDEIQQDYFDNLKEIFNLNQDITIDGLNKAKELLSEDKFSGFNFEKVMRGLDIAVQNNRLTTGEPTEIISSENKNWNANADVDKSEDLNNLFKDEKKKLTDCNDSK